MKARVYDKERNCYFKSEVYAIINQGIFRRYLVLIPQNENICLRFFNACDKTEGASYPPYHPNINTIISQMPGDWIFRNKESLSILGNKTTCRLDCYNGPSWILEDNDMLLALINGESIIFDNAGFADKRIDSNIPGWNYIEDSDDVTKLMELFNHFHDSVIKDLYYVSGSRVYDDGSMSVTDHIRQISVILDSQWSKSIEMIFEGVLALNLRPAHDTYSSDIFVASFIIKDETILFYDDELTTEQLAYKGTWIKAFSLRWRFSDTNQRGITDNFDHYNMVKGSPYQMQ